ncbi:variant leucine-rich repeat-containing protein [Leucobacter sp. HY1908]
MTDPRVELSQPATTAERLAQIASERPDLAAEIAAHPNAYPELRAWLAQYGAPAAALGQPSGQATTQQFAQPTQQFQAPGQPFAQPAQQFGAGSPGSPGKPRSKRTLLIVLASVLALILAIGGGAWWFIAGKIGGSSSPEAAATKLLHGLTNQDLLALYGSLAPSEFAPFEEPFKRVAAISSKDADTSVNDSLAELRNAITITADGIETRNEVIAEGVERVIFSDGSITFDGDSREVGRIVAQLTRAYDPDATSSSMRDLEYEIADELDLPYTLDFAEIRRDARDYGGLFEGVSVVSVQEPGGWYVSPLMTIADYFYLDAGNSDYRLGNKIIEAKPSASPEQAAEELVSAFIGDGFSGIAPYMPLAERRLISIYGQFPGDPFNPSESGLEVYEQQFSAKVSGDRARLTIEELSIGAESREHGFDLFNGVTITGQCAEFRSEWTYDDSDSYYYEEWELRDSVDSGCLSDIPLASEFGFDEIAVIAVKEGGGWFVSPLATYADALSIVTERVAQLSEDGRLTDVIEEELGY